MSVIIPTRWNRCWIGLKANPDAAMCGGKVDFIDEDDTVSAGHLTAPFNLPCPSRLRARAVEPLVLFQSTA